MAKLFSKEDETWIRENYPYKSWDEILSRFPGKTKTQLSSKAHCLGIQRKNVSCSFYSGEEDNIIREKYRSVPIDELVSKWLPGRTKGSIIARASILGVHKQGCWSKEEDQIILDNYYDMPMSELSKLIPYRAKSAIHFRIRQLGLRGASMYKYSNDDIQFVRENYLFMSDEELGKCLHRRGNSIKELRRKNKIYRKDLCAPTNYRGVLMFIQANNTEWKKRSMESCGYKNVIDGDAFNDIHHLYAKNLILNQALENIGMKMPDDINALSEDEKNIILRAFFEEQGKYPLGVCLNKRQHILFHRQYGFGWNTPEQFVDFIKKFYPESLDEIKKRI